MSSQTKRKYRNIRTEFKHDLRQHCTNNKALAMLFIEHRSSWHHRRHITQIWGMFINPEYNVFQKAYNKKLFGKFLTGTDSFWRMLYFADRDLYDKYNHRIPERFAMGDALGVAYGVLRS